jgi:hypothetical protein
MLPHDAFFDVNTVQFQLLTIVNQLVFKIGALNHSAALPHLRNQLLTAAG